LEITSAGESFNTDLAHLIARDSLDGQDSELVRFIEVATWQNAIGNPDDHVIFPRGRSYFMDPTQHGYTGKDLESYTNGCYLGYGLSKSAKLIEGYGGQAGISIIVEPKLTLFHGGAMLTDRFRQQIEAGQFDRAYVEGLIRGLYFVPVHLIEHLNKARMFKIHNLGDSADLQTFEIGEESWTVADYFAHNYAPLQFPKLPVIVVRNRGREDSYFPFEHIELFDNQVLTRPDPTLIASLVTHAAVKPAILKERIAESFDSLFLKGSDFMLNAGIEISEAPIDLEVPILTAPKLYYAQNRQATFEEAKSNWKTGVMRFVAPAQLKDWCAFVAIRGRDRRYFGKPELIAFVRAYAQMCREKGMKVFDLNEETEARALNVEGSFDELHQVMKMAKEQDYKFAIVITELSDTDAHPRLKSYEQQLGIVTQNVTYNVARGAAGIGERPLRTTMENIVNKSNVKLGGLNYQVVNGNTLLGKEDLFIGFALNHVAAGMGNLNDTDVPSVLGYAANDSNEPIAFTSDFIYHKPVHQGFVPAISQAINNMFERFLKSREKIPKRVIVYRSGCSDGEMKNVLTYEVPLFLDAIDYYFEGKSKLVLMVVSKFHTARFMPLLIQNRNSKPVEQNIPSGVVIDSTVVHPLPEFYLGAHRAIQGTAKIPRYNVLYNNAGMTLADIEKTSYDLCFCHQIISSTISEPSPVYCAKETAKRGRDLYNSRVNRPIIEARQREFLRQEQNEEAKEEYASALTKDLSYAAWPIRNQRFNA